MFLLIGSNIPVYAECNSSPPLIGYSTADLPSPQNNWQICTGTSSSSQPATLRVHLLSGHSYVFSLCSVDGGSPFGGTGGNPWMNLYDGNSIRVATNDNYCGNAPRLLYTSSVGNPSYRIVITASDCNSFGNGNFTLAYADLTPCADGSRSGSADSSVVAVLPDPNGSTGATGILIASTRTPWVPYVLSVEHLHGGQVGPYIKFTDGTLLQATWVSDQNGLGLWRLPSGDYRSRQFWGWSRSGMPSNIYVRHYSRMQHNQYGTPNAAQYYADGTTIAGTSYAWSFSGPGQNEWFWYGSSGSPVREYGGAWLLYAVASYGNGGNVASNCTYPANSVYDSIGGIAFGSSFTTELGSNLSYSGRMGGVY